MKVTYDNGYISFGVRNKKEREIRGTENRTSLLMCIYNTRNNQMKTVFSYPQPQL